MSDNYEDFCGISEEEIQRLRDQGYNEELIIQAKKLLVTPEKRLKETRLRVKRFVLRVVIPLTIIGVIGVLLLAVGEEIYSTPLVVVGSIVAGVGFVPLLVIGIVVAYRRGVPIWC